MVLMAPTESPDKGKPIDRSARRREKSRDAARCRRQQESDTYNEICKVMPIPPKTLGQMDRSTVMRLLISFMKLRSVLNTAQVEFDELKAEHMDCKAEVPDSEYIDALNGFIIVLSHDCDLLFVSENVKHYIGITDLDLMGQNLFSYTHEGDHSEITNCLKESADQTTERSFFIRMRSTLTSTGKNVNLKSALYKVLKCEGVVHQSHDDSQRIMVAYCEPIPHPANIEMVLDCSTFLSQHSLDMKFTFCDDDRVSKLLLYSEEDMIQKSFYDFCYTEDIRSLEESFKKLFRLGQVTTNMYRMLSKSGGYVWVTTEATIINNPRNQQPSYIVCVHYVVSDVVEEKCILSLPQLNFVKEIEANFPKLEEIAENELDPLDCTEAIFESSESLCDSTDSIFLGPNDATDAIFDSTSEVFIPCKESLETMAKNAPSIGDEIEFSQIAFGNKLPIDEELYKNAPSIGDPTGDIQVALSSLKGSPGTNDLSAMMIDVDRKGVLKDEFTNGLNSGDSARHESQCLSGDKWRSTFNCKPPDSLSLVSATGTKRKLAKESEIISVPKTQYQRHVQPTMELYKDSGTYKFNPPEQNKESCFSNPPNKKQRQHHMIDPEKSTSINQKEDYRMCLPPEIASPIDVTPDTMGTGVTGSVSKQPVAKNNNYPLEVNEWESGADSSLWTGTWNRESDCNFNVDYKEPYTDLGPSCFRVKSESSSSLPVLSLHDCEINAPIEDNSNAPEWLAFSDILSGVA